MGVRHVVLAAGDEFAGFTIESVLGTGEWVPSTLPSIPGCRGGMR